MKRVSSEIACERNFADLFYFSRNFFSFFGFIEISRDDSTQADSDHSNRKLNMQMMLHNGDLWLNRFIIINNYFNQSMFANN